MRNIHRSEKNQDLMDRFVETRHAGYERKIFNTYREFMCFLAVLGFENERRKPVSSNLLDIDSRAFYDWDLFPDILYLLAIGEAKKPEILHPSDANEEECLTIFEEYVEGGCEVLREWMASKPEDEFGHLAIISALKSNRFIDQQVTTTPSDVEVLF